MERQRCVVPGRRGLDFQFGGHRQDAQRHRRPENDPGAVGSGNTGGRGLCRRGASERPDRHRHYRRIQPSGRDGDRREAGPLRGGGAGDRPPLRSPNHFHAGPFQVDRDVVARQSGTLLRPCAAGRRTGHVGGRRGVPHGHGTGRHDSCSQDHPYNVARARSACGDLLRVDRDACQLCRVGQVPGPLRSSSRQ